MRDRNIAILKNVVKYADEVGGTIARFNLDFEKFKSDYVVKNAISMCILQIGELAKHLTDEFLSTHAKIPWREIISVRNRAVHAYGNTDLRILWDIATDDVPELKAYCEGILSMESSC